MAGVWRTAARAASSPWQLPAERAEGVPRTLPPVPVNPPAQQPRPLQAAPAISLRIAALTWLVGWLAGNIAGSAVLAASGTANQAAADRPAWVAVCSAAALWIPQLVALVLVSRRFATGRPFADYGLSFRSVDLVGIPIGVLSQLVLLRLVYWPLQTWWPNTFSDKHLDQNAKELYDTAKGIWVVILVLVIVVGAPFVEELVYRGLLMSAARRSLNDGVALVAVAVFFALIHFRPVEYPGLFAFGLVLGACLLATDRIGMGIIAT